MLHLILVASPWRGFDLLECSSSIYLFLFLLFYSWYDHVPWGITSSSADIAKQDRQENNEDKKKKTHKRKQKIKKKNKVQETEIKAGSRV